MITRTIDWGDGPNGMAGYLKYARTLTFGQWNEEVLNNGPISLAIIRELNSFPEREPLRSFIERLSLEFPASPDVWDLHNVSITTDEVRLFISFEYGAFTERYSRGTISGSEPVETSVDGEQDYYLFDVSAVFRVNDSAQVTGEILDICAQTPEGSL